MSHAGLVHIYTVFKDTDILMCKGSIKMNYFIYQGLPSIEFILEECLQSKSVHLKLYGYQ